jgi:hypothetical protein
MPRGQALAGIGEALQKSAERLKARGFQTRMQPAAGAFKTKAAGIAAAATILAHAGNEPPDWSLLKIPHAQKLPGVR